MSIMKITMSGLNILYSFSTEFLQNNRNYENSSCISYKEIYENHINDQKINDFQSLAQETCISFMEFQEKIGKISFSLKKSDFQVCFIDKIQKLSYKYKLIIVNQDFSSLLIDYYVLKLHEIDNYFEFITENELLNRVFSHENSKFFIILDHSIKKLIDFKKLGCWVGYISNLNFNLTDKKRNVNDILNENIKLYNETGEMSGYIDFSSISFYNQEVIYDKISEIVLKNQENPSQIQFNQHNYPNKTLSNQLKSRLFNKKEGKVVLILASNLITSISFTRSDFFISTPSLIYWFFVTVNDMYCKYVDLICIRFNELQEYYFYDYILLACQTCLMNKMVNSIETAFKISHRGRLNEMLVEFMTLFKSKKSLSNHMSKEFLLEIPHKLNITYTDLLSNKTNTLTDINSKIMQEYNSEIIIKFSSKSNITYNHLIIFVFNENGWREFKKNMISIYNDDLDLEITIEKYVQHVNCLYKMYFMNGKTKINLKESIPENIKEEIGEKGIFIFIQET